MTAPWTPGPWAWAWSEDLLEDALVVAGHTEIASVHGGPDRKAADARLIAAAPEMAELLALICSPEAKPFAVVQEAFENGWSLVQRIRGGAEVSA